ncbi:IS110 family transposase [Aestuariicoccus sp. MJ-SS9]|uniref:IS110 family transposase n=1 Tax=Aestuariicoccus sp. MJ-SS9 TaxID=3079855 RepID=UPI00290851E5|nr:transposase [Aestuariicoccus sp. MJ-SS9]MDU8911006.1 transposase [Aestuariicoccus sp. MJ-SS9]
MSRRLGVAVSTFRRRPQAPRSHQAHSLCLGDQRWFRHSYTAEGHSSQVAMLRQIPGAVKVGFLAEGGREWVLRTELVAAGIVAVRRSPSQIKAFAPSRGTRAKTDRIDAEPVARFVAFRLAAGREEPDENRRILRTLTTRAGQLVDLRKGRKAQISGRTKRGVSVDLEARMTI